MNATTTTNTPKVYKTSIVPAGERLEPVRSTKIVASALFIEVLHILITAGILAFLFAGMWKRATQSEKAVSATKTA